MPVPRRRAPDDRVTIAAQDRGSPQRKCTKATTAGLLGISSVLLMVILTYPIGRVAGPVWIVLGIVGYYFYRRSRAYPFPGSLRRDWSTEQLAVYEESGETELAAEYR